MQVQTAVHLLAVPIGAAWLGSSACFVRGYAQAIRRIVVARGDALADPTLVRAELGAEALDPARTFHLGLRFLTNSDRQSVGG